MIDISSQVSRARMLQIFASFVETAQIAMVGSPTSSKAKCSCARRTRNAVRATNLRGADEDVGFERTRPRWPDHGSRRAISMYCNANSQNREEVRNQAGNLGGFDLIQHLPVACKRHGKKISSVAYTITTINRHRKLKIPGMALSDESALRSSHNT